MERRSEREEDNVINFAESRAFTGQCVHRQGQPRRESVINLRVSSMEVCDVELTSGRQGAVDDHQSPCGRTCVFGFEPRSDPCAGSGNYDGK